MPGGLLQLLTIGLQDAPLVLNPEITYFKMIHRRHTNFSLEEIIKTIGPKKFNTFFQYKINTVTDLLAGFHFIIDIPYFNVLKKVVSTNNTTSTLEINELSVLYDNVKTYLLFDSVSNNYYLAPETFFNLSKNDEYYDLANGYDLEKNLLNGYDLINSQDYGNTIKVFSLKDSNLNQIIPVLRLYFDQFNEFWLRIFNETRDINYFGNIKSQLSLVSELKNKLDLILYDGFTNYNIFNKFRKYLNFKDEIIQYLSFDEVTTENPIYDSDFAKNYAIDFSLSVNTYKYNAIKFNSLIYLFFIQNLYPDFSSKIRAYTFWKKHTLGIKNKVEETIIENNYFLEWTNKINLYQNTSFGNFNKIESQIYETFRKKYFNCEQKIVSLFTDLDIKNKEKTWCILKVFYEQFTNNTNNIICFDDHFNPNSSTLSLNYNIKNLFENSYQNLLTNSNLSSTWTNFDDSDYIQPVDLALVYPYLSYRFLDEIINLSYFNDHHFMVLWRNKITIAYCFRLTEILDNYYSEKTNDNTFQNTFLDLNDFSKTLKNLTFYYNINLNRNIKLDNLRYEMNQLFNYESFYGSINIDTNDLSSNFILASPSYVGLEDISYNILNQNMVITDEKYFTYLYDLNENVITIDNWNSTIYDKIFIEIDGGFIELTNFKFINNQLLLYPSSIIPIKTLNNKIYLRMIKDILIPIVVFNPITDMSGNANYANLNLNTNNYPDISFGLIVNKDISFNSTNLFSSFDNIISKNDFNFLNDKLQLKTEANFNNNKFYELKITDYQLNIERKVIYLDENKNVVPNVNLDFNKIKQIDLIDYDLNLNLKETDIDISNNLVDISGSNQNSFYWLVASKDSNNIPLPKNIFLPLRKSDTKYEIIGDISNYHWDLYDISNSYVPNLFPILSHYYNQDVSGNTYNYQLNSHFYQKPFIISTYHQYLVTDNLGNLIDQSGNLIDQSGNVIDEGGNRIFVDGVGTILEYTFDLNGNKQITTGDYIVLDSSGNPFLNSQPDGLGVDNTDYGVITYKTGPGLWNKFALNNEPIFYFYNIPMNENTISIKLNNKTVNKIMPINPCEFYIHNNDKYPVVYDPINVKTSLSKKEIVNKYNNDFDLIFKEDTNFKNLIEIIENANSLYENLYLDLIKTLKTLGKTSSDTIKNSVTINTKDLQNYNSFDYDTFSLFTPSYYNLSATSISTGLGIQKFKISNKGYILTQFQQNYKSHKKINPDLTSYLNFVSDTLIKNINDISDYQNLLDIYNQGNYSESYKPLYYIENIINNNLYSINNFKIESLFDLSGNYSDDKTLIYFNNILVDISSNNIASGENLIEISEKKIYKTNVFENNINDFKDSIFNFMGAVHFEKDNFVFFDNYSFINDISNCYILLDNNNIVKLRDTIKDESIVNYKSKEFILSNPQNISTNTELFIYDVKIDISNNIESITGNSMIINFDFYQFQEISGNFIIKGTKPLNLINKYLICGNSSGSINTFIPENFILVKNITVYNNFKTNIYFSGDNGNKIAYLNDKYTLLDSISDLSFNYYSIYTDESNISLYDISNSYLIPPFTLDDGAINLSQDNRDFIIKNFYEQYYYKLDNEIVRGDKLKNLDISGNYKLWIYSDNNLKLIDTDKTVDISNNRIYFSSITDLPNYTFYYVNGFIYYVDIIENGYLIKNILSEDISGGKLYYLDDNNFNMREEQYISIIDISSTEKLVPSIDLSANNLYSKDSSIYSFYSFDFKNKNKEIYDNELDILVAFTDPSDNKFMKPYSYNSDISNGCQSLYIIRDNKNYYNFFFYKESDLVNNYISGFLDSNNFATDLSCNDNDFVIDSSFNFTLKGSDGFRKYKVLINNGQFYSTFITLKVDSSNNSYDSIFTMLGPNTPLQLFSPENLYNENANPNIVELNTGFDLLGNNPLVFRDNNYVKLNNMSTNSIRQQLYYHSNILLKNQLIKLEIDYDSSWDILPELDYLGVTTNINGNVISSEKTISNSNYLIFLNNEKAYYREALTVDTSNNLFYLNAELENHVYNIYASSRKIFFNENKITIFENNKNYYISSYQRKSLRIGDIILVGNNIFEVAGLNSFTLFYDLINIQINDVKSSYPGFYLLYRLNSTPKLPEFKITDFTINDTSNYKMTIDSSYNILLETSNNNFSVGKGENILLYVKGKELFNCFNYTLNPNDYIIYNSTIYRIKLIKDGIIKLVNNIDLTIIINLNLSEGFYSFYVPYQPCLMRNIHFDTSGNLDIDFENSFRNLYFYELNGTFTNSLTYTPNATFYTRVINFKEEDYYFQNKTNSHLRATIYGNVLVFEDDISDYDLYYNQHIKVDSFVSHIRNVNLPNEILLKDTIYPSSRLVKVYFGVKNSNEAFSNYKLETSVSMKPFLSLSKYHIYDFSGNQLINYDISSNYSTQISKIFEDNVLNLDLSNNMINLDNSYHILLEKTKFNQYISHICKILFPNKIHLFTAVENYNSNFYLDKIYPVILNVNNTFSFKNQKIIQQTLIPKIPYNEIEIWKKYDLILIGAVENLTNGFRVQIDETEFFDFIETKEFYLDRTIKCTIESDAGNYYLVTDDYLDKFEYLYTKEINYLKSSTKLNYDDIVKINPYFVKDNTLEIIKIPVQLNFLTNIDYYYYSISNDLNLLINNENYKLSAGILNLNVNNYYIDTVINKRVVTTLDELVSKNCIYLNDIETNILDESRLYLDGDACVSNIFRDSDFLLSSLLNQDKSWPAWSLLTCPDMSNNILSKGNFYVDISKNITRDTSEIYFTKSEERDISSFLVNINGKYNIYQQLKEVEQQLYTFLPSIFKYDKFWEDPKTYINTFIDDNGFDFYFDGTDFILNNDKITYLVLNNQFDLSFNEITEIYSLTRNIELAKVEISNLITNTYDNNLYGVKLTDVIKHFINLGKELSETKNNIFSFTGKCVNFVDLIINLVKNKLYGRIQDFDDQYRKLQNSLSVENFSTRGLDVTNNYIYYNNTFDNCQFYKDFPANPTEKIYQTNTPVDIDYKVDTSAGLYPYKISVTDENYIDYTVYKVDFLEDELLKKIISIDFPIVYNNQIEFFAKNNFDINHQYSICSYKTYDISNYSLLGYVYQIDLSANDLNALDMSLFSLIKYKNMELTTYNNYLIFPTYIDSLTSYIHTELNIAVDTYDISGDATFITLLKINQVLNATSNQYTLYLSSDNKQYRIDDIYGKEIRVRAKISEFVNTKIILSIKYTSVTYKNLYLYQLNLAQPLTNYSYYLDLVNVPKNFLINDIIFPKDITFVGDDILNVLIKTSDISSVTKFNNIVHYAKVGEFPPEPIEEMNKKESYLYQFNDTPPINDISSCFICFDTSYNNLDSSGFIANFLSNINNYDYKLSTDVLKNSNYTQFVCNQFVSNKDLHDHTFGGVINSWEIKQYTYFNDKLKFKPFDNFIFDSKYTYYLNEQYVDISNFFFYKPSSSLFKGGVDISGVITGETITYPINWSEGYIEIIAHFDASWNNLIFKQIIIEPVILKPINNQLTEIKLFDPLDVRFDGYIQTLDEKGDEIGNYIYLFDLDLSHNFIENTTIYFNSDKVIEGKVLLDSPLYVVTNEKLENIKSIYVKEINETFENVNFTLIQDAFIPFTLYKKIELGRYEVFIREKDLYFLDEFTFNKNNLNKFYLINKFAKFKLEKRFYSQKITPSPELSTSTTNTIITTETIERAKFKENLYRLLFEYIEFYIGDQLIESLNKDIMEIQYQFFKDTYRKKQFDKIVKSYDYNNKLRLIIPLEFWFTDQSSLYLPMISLIYTQLSLKFKINDVLNLLTNGNKNSLDNITYSVLNVPEIHIDLNIDGILLDTPERELFGNNSHEYIIERFKQYPDSLIDSKNSVSRMKFKNLVKDVFFSTEIIKSKDKTYITEKVKKDIYQIDYDYKKALYTAFLQIGVYTDVIKKEYTKDYDYIKQSMNDIKLNTTRYSYFMESAFLSTFNMEMLLYIDLKYQQFLTTLEEKRANLEKYCSYLYKYKVTKYYTSPIDELNIKTSGTDLFRSMESSYFNLVVPYQKYFNTVDPGYYCYSFALSPLEKQPSGHINFTTLDDITVNIISNEKVKKEPYILKTMVREYQIVRIMSGMGALAWMD